MYRLRSALLFSLALVMTTAIGRAESNSDMLDLDADITEQLPGIEAIIPLFLAVSINGKSIGLVAEFSQHMDDNRVSITRKELTEIGLKAPQGVSKQVFLDTIPGLKFDYDDAAQEIAFSAAFSALLPKVTSAARRPEFQEPQKTYGAVMNYSIATDINGQKFASDMTLSSISASLDGWVFAPFGTLGSTGYYQYNATDQTGEFIRQETRYEYNDAEHALTVTVGDFQSSSLQWSRPVRMAGVQLRRDFSLRSDIITQQRLTYSGAAAVPSTVDVFIENNRAFSGSVEAGPFRLEDLPLYTGSGDAVVVIRDQNGDETSEEVSFFASQNLLKKGVADYSIEAGWAREAFGQQSNEYGTDPVASGSLRYGLTEKMTIEGHAELKSDMKMFGIGLTAVPLNFGEISVAVGQSSYRGENSAFVHGTLRTSIFGADLNMSVLRSQSGFADLALATGVDFLGSTEISDTGSLLEFPTSLEVISLAIPITRDQRKLGLSLVHSTRANSEDFIASASFGSTVPGTAASFGVTASHNFSNDESRAAINFSMPIGNRRSVRAGVGRDVKGRGYGSVSLARPIGESVGDHGYSLQLENNGGLQFGSFRGDYRSRYGKVGVEVVQSETTTSLRGRFNGAVAAAGSTIAFGNQVNDSFAVVDVGIPDIPVYSQNRPITRTNANGKALVYGLGSYRRNRISVEVDDIPENYTLNATAMDVVPARRSGSLVDFKGNSAPSVLVVLRDASGAHLPPGSVAFLNGRSDEFYVGYDGMAWLEDVKASNTLEVQMPSGTCAAQFEYATSGDVQDVIDPVECK